MEYRIKFVDGPDTLKHYGVKGMKWGVWNPETTARYMAGKPEGLDGGGGGIVDDEPDSEDDGKHLYDTLVDFANDPTTNDFSDFTDKVTALALSQVAESQAAKDGKAAVDDALAAVDKARAYSSAGDNLSESTKESMRQKARAEKQKQTRQKREKAKANGDPLWMFAG